MEDGRSWAFDGRVCFGVIILSLGVLFLLSNFYPHFHVWRFIVRLWPVILIILGISILFNQSRFGWHTGNVQNQGHSRVIGDTRLDFKGQEIGNINASQVIGDSVIDLAGGKLKPGINHIHSSMVIGDLLVLIPTAFPVKISAKILLGDIKYGSRRENGFSPRMEYTDENYEISENKLFIELNGLLGDITLQRV